MRHLLLAPFLLLTVAASDRDAARVEKSLAGKVAGAPKDCLNRFESAQMSVHDGLVLFRVNSKLTYRNDMNLCSTLTDDDILVTHLYGTNQLCRGDIAEIVDRTSGFGRGSCSFGDFVPYTAPAG